jgi:hypothetical protein
MLATLCVLCAFAVEPAAQTGAHPPKQRTTPEVWHPRLERFTPPGTLQTEFGSALSDEGFRKLRAALPWRPPSERADYYFDAYDGHQFLLRTGGMPLKVRIKLKKQEARWQVSRFVAKDRVLIGPLAIKVHTTESWDSRVDEQHAAALLAASDEFASRIGVGGALLRDAAERVDAAWQRLRAETLLPGLQVIDRTVAGRAYHFYPRKVTPSKTRLSATLPGVATPVVTLMLGTEPEIDADGQSVLTYELEAEAEGPVTRAQSRTVAMAIGRLMLQAGITERDQQEVPSMSNAYTLHQLAR